MPAQTFSELIIDKYNLYLFNILRLQKQEFWNGSLSKRNIYSISFFFFLSLGGNYTITSNAEACKFKNAIEIGVILLNLQEVILKCFYLVHI